MQMPPIEYAWRGDVSLAYQVLGSGPIDLIYLQGYLSNVEINWENPRLARFLRELATHTRLIVTDRRGLGLSERFTPADTPPTEVLMDDVAAVIAAAGSVRPVLFATGDCGPMAMHFAASHPEEISGLILYGTHPTIRKTEDTPWGLTDSEAIEEAEWVRDQFTSGQWMVRTNPSVASQERDVEWGARYERLSLTPGAVYTESIRFSETDVRSVLPTIQTPTLVLHRTEDPEDEIEGARFLAGQIRTATLVELAGSDHFPWMGDQDAVLREVTGFLASVRAEEADFDRVLATVLFTDIAGSTQTASDMGDVAWSSLLEKHYAIMRSVLSRYRGTEVNTTGDGVVATFDGPGRALRCAFAAVEASGRVGLQIRVGAHTGEIQRLPGDIEGLAVHVAARVVALAEPGETLVSRTVKELVSGSGLEFADRGTFELKGIPGDWQLFRAVQPAT